MKEAEKRVQQVRSQYFSSVAHELRTPLNSIIPILRILLETFVLNAPMSSRMLELLNIVLNSSIHL